jgi:hypothetical protein
MPTVAELHEAITEVAEFLEARSLPYANEVRLSADEVGRSDAHGAHRYIGLSRLLLDLYFHPAVGTAASAAEGERLQQQFEALHSRALSLAEALLRASR